MPAANQRALALQLIRLSLMAGVLIFGAVDLIVHRQPSWKPEALPPVIGYALVAVAIVAVSIAVLLRGRLGREADPERRSALLIMGWAAGEGAGLFGAVIFFLTGQAQWYLFGLLAMLCTFVLLRPDASMSVAAST